jgi:predicted nucleic-acid-binding Zn-ribbon protein
MGLFSGSEPTPQTTVTGKPLLCLVCGNDHFHERKAQLNTAVATFLNFDWANQSGDCFVCSECGYIHWFVLSE